MAKVATGSRPPGLAIDDAALMRATANAAAEAAVPARALHLQALLHLPRLIDASGQLDEPELVGEVRRLARLLAGRAAPYGDWMAGPARAPRRPQDLVLARDDATAHVLLERFHYLGSPRDDGPQLVARAAGGCPAAVLSLSPADMAWVESAFADVSLADVGVLSRVFAFDWVPRNSISYLLGALVRRLGQLGWRKRLLLTYLNPNLGFDGASYRAANWTLLAREHGTRYAYLDGDYITDRVLRRRFGSDDRDSLATLLGSRIAFSRGELAPLDVYALALDPALRSRLADRAPARVERP